jgi:hypothetical protein
VQNNVLKPNLAVKIQLMIFSLHAAQIRHLVINGAAVCKLPRLSPIAARFAGSCARALAEYPLRPFFGGGGRKDMERGPAALAVRPNNNLIVQSWFGYLAFQSTAGVALCSQAFKKW